MKQTKKALALLLCMIMTITAFCGVPLSASAEGNNSVDSQMVVAEVPTEGETESTSDGTVVELIDTVNENTEEVSSELVDNTGDYSKSQKTLQNESSAGKNAVESSASAGVVEFSESPITLGVGEVYTFSKVDLQKELSASSTTTYTWSSNNANIVSVDKNGKITAKKVGETTINVSASNGKKTFCRVVVKNAPTKVTIGDTSVTLGVGETYNTYKTINSGAYANSFTWISSNSSVATVEKISLTQARITAKGVGTATITVITYNGRTDTCQVTVKKAPTKVTLNKASVTLGVGETYSAIKTIDSDAYANQFTWSSSNSSVAIVQKISLTQARVTAKGVGTATVTIRTYNGKTATCTVTVKNAPTKITLNKTAIALGAGETFALSSSLPSGTASDNIKYSSSNTSVATVNSSTGLITARSVGTAVITVATYNGKKATCTVTVKNAPTAITLNKTAITLGVGETFDLNASLPSGTTAYSVKYSSNNTSIATVDSYGLITAKKVGTAVITVTTYNNKKATCTVTIKNAPTTITLNKTKITLSVGETLDLNSSLPSGTASYSIKYSSSNTGVATVAAAGGLVTAKKVGTAVITATTYNGKKATCTVTVQKNITEEYVNEVLRLTNEERKKAGLPALAKRTDVDKVAAIRAEEISVKFSHTRPNGKNCFSIISENGISYTALGENIAAGQESPEEVVDAWMNSDGHRKNILNSKYKGLGVGCYIEDDTIYWVQMMIG